MPDKDVPWSTPNSSNWPSTLSVADRRPPSSLLTLSPAVAVAATPVVAATPEPGLPLAAAVLLLVVVGEILLEAVLQAAVGCQAAWTSCRHFRR